MSVSNVNVGIPDGDKLQQGNVPDEKEVLIELGHTQVPVTPTQSSALGRLKTDDKFRHRFLHTACVCWTMVSLGWRVGLVGPTFPDLRQIIQEDLSVASWIFTAISLGGLIGSVCGGALYDRIDKTVLYVGITVGFAVFAGVTPWCSNFPAMFAAHTLHGGFASAIDTGVTSLSCYWCDSKTSSMCGDGGNFRLTSNDTSYIRTNCLSCLKTVTSDKEIIRNCSIKHNSSIFLRLGCEKEKFAEVCGCSKDLCNSALYIITSFPVLIGSCLATILT